MGYMCEMSNATANLKLTFITQLYFIVDYTCRVYWCEKRKKTITAFIGLVEILKKKKIAQKHFLAFTSMYCKVKSGKFDVFQKILFRNIWKYFN